MGLGIEWTACIEARSVVPGGGKSPQKSGEKDEWKLDESETKDVECMEGKIVGGFTHGFLIWGETVGTVQIECFR